jgi:hypothetical protein
MNMITEATTSSETFVLIYQTTRRRVTEHNSFVFSRTESFAQPVHLRHVFTGCSLY